MLPIPQVIYLKLELLRYYLKNIREKFTLIASIKNRGG
jgi:hypothetical protein